MLRDRHVLLGFSECLTEALFCDFSLLLVCSGFYISDTAPRQRQAIQTPGALLSNLCECPLLCSKLRAEILHGGKAPLNILTSSKNGNPRCHIANRRACSKNSREPSSGSQTWATQTASGTVRTSCRRRSRYWRRPRPSSPSCPSPRAAAPPRARRGRAGRRSRNPAWASCRRCRDWQ